MSHHRVASEDEAARLDHTVRQVLEFARAVSDDQPGDLLELLFSAFLSQLQAVREMGPQGNTAGLVVMAEVLKLVTALADEPDPIASGALLDAIRDALTAEKH